MISQRYLEEDLAYENNDEINERDTLQRHLAQKLSELISQNVEYCHVQQDMGHVVKKAKSKLKLLQDAECYVSAESPEVAGASCGKLSQKKPKFKRRSIDKEENEQSERERLESAAISAESLMRGDEVKLWAQRPTRPHKVFHYKMGKKNVANLQESTNEFSKLRNKNQWNESKIAKRKILT